MEFEVTILGANAAIPANKRFPSSQFLKAGRHRFLIDCGEGTQIRLQDFAVKKGKIRHIFISHLHADHYAGLFGLLGTYILQHREQPLTIFAPPGLEEIIRLQFFYSGTLLPFPLTFVELQPGFNKLFEDDAMEVFSFPIKHRIEAYGFLFSQKEQQRKIIKEKAKEHNIPLKAFSCLKKGENYKAADGSFFSYEEFTEPPPEPASYAYVSDSVFDPQLQTFLQNVTVLYHEATFAADLEEKALKTMHSTSVQAAEIAKMSGAKKLIIGHFSTRYKDTGVLKDEAASVFKASFAAEEGKTYKIAE